MKNILVVFTNSIAYNDGATCVMLNYIRNMNFEGLHIDFASHNDADDKLIKELNSKGIRYFNLGKRKAVLYYFFNLRRLLKEYDVLHVNGNSATTSIELIAGKSVGTKIRIAHIHNSKNTHPIIHKILLPLFNWSFNRGVACSTIAGDWIFGKGKFMVLRNAIDIDKYKYTLEGRILVRNRLHILKESVVLGHVGMFNEQKNHKQLLAVFKEYVSRRPDSYLILVGDGILKEEIKKKAKDMGVFDKVVFLGKRSDIPDLLQAMDTFIFPSLFEGLPLSVLEAQAAGLPCILSNNVTKEVGIGEDVCFLDLCLSPDKWAMSIDKQSFNNTRKERCERNITRLTAAGYNIKTEANKLRDIYLDRI